MSEFRNAHFSDGLTDPLEHVRVRWSRVSVCTYLRIEHKEVATGEYISAKHAAAPKPLGDLLFAVVPRHADGGDVIANASERYQLLYEWRR